MPDILSHTGTEREPSPAGDRSLRLALRGSGEVGQAQMKQAQLEHAEAKGNQLRAWQRP